MRYGWLLILVLLIVPVRAQESAPPLTVTAYQQVLVYAGPDITFAQVDVLRPGIPAQIVERNQLGNWLRLERRTDEGEVVLDGWVLAAFLNRDPQLRYSAVPVNRDVRDFAPENVNSRSMAQLYAQPLLPTIHEAMAHVYERGQELGNRSDVLTKVGDSLSASEQYITPFSAEEYELGPYDYLEATLRYYSESAGQASVASRIGMSSYVVFDPFWATDERCMANESPLACEYRLKRPSVAFILFGPNDVRSMTEDEYREQMRQIIEQSIDAGVIPVLSTFGAHPDETFFWQSINFNLELLALAEEYEVPLMNLWAGAQLLPNRGMDEDLVHLTHSGFDTLKYDTGHEAFYGISLQNLLVLHTLYELRQTLGLGQ